MPGPTTHDFVFVSTQSGERFYSFRPRGSHTYSYNRPYGTFHGRLATFIDLSPGSYIIELAPLEGRDYFHFDHLHRTHFR
jgi:hypothetical protein